jgi:hypothetical protein
VRFANDVGMSVVIIERVGYDVNVVLRFPGSFVACHNVIDSPHPFGSKTTNEIFRLFLRMRRIVPAQIGTIN